MRGVPVRNDGTRRDIKRAAGRPKRGIGRLFFYQDAIIRIRSEVSCIAVFLLHLSESCEPLLDEEIHILPADGAGMGRDQYVGQLP